MPDSTSLRPRAGEGAQVGPALCRGGSVTSILGGQCTLEVSMGVGIAGIPWAYGTPITPTGMGREMWMGMGSTGIPWGPWTPTGNKRKCGWEREALGSPGAHGLPREWEGKCGWK